MVHISNKILRLLFLVIIISANTVVQAASVSNLVTPVSYFTNHVNQLDELSNNLHKYKQTSIVGTSGIGKTQLARMYAYENKDKYSLIWFIDCNFNLKQEFLKLARTINQLSKKQLVSEDLAIIEEEVINYLSTLDNWLLVFDNNKTKGNLILQKFIKLKHNGHVIFCSQDSQGLPYVVKVKEFTKKDAAVLAGYILKDNSVQDVNFLIEEFKGYPVLIVQGAQILNNVKGLSNVKYKKMIKETDNKIKLNIELCMKELSTSAKALLKKIALINNQRFSKNMLRMITNNKENFDDDIYQLSRFLLISNIDSNKFEMHDVIAETLQEMNTKIKNQQYLEEMISNILEKSFPKGVAERQIFRTASTIIENLQIILRNAEKYKINLSKILEVKIELLGISVDVGDYNSSQKLIEWFEEKNRNKEFNLDQMNNHEKVLYVWYLSTTGFYNMVALSNPIKAIEYYIKAKEMAVSIDGYEDMKFNVTYQIFRAQLELGQIKFAQNTLEEAYKIYEIGIKNNTINSSEMCYFYFGRTRLFLAQGRYKDALEQIDHAIEFLKQSGIKETSMFLQQSYQMKIEIMNYLKLYKEAYSLSEWLYNVLKPFKGADHEIFANIYAKMAVSQYGLQRYKEGLEYANKAIAMFIKIRNIEPKKLQFTKDIQLAKALMIKADCLAALDNIEESLNIYEKVEAIHNNIYINNLSSSITLKHALFEATKTACKHHKKTNEFWFKHFYGNLRSIFGIDIREVKEIEQTCNPEMYNKLYKSRLNLTDTIIYPI